jgi:small subunit ribosomal protein S3
MGQKVHPFAFRLGPLYTWKSRWYSDPKTYVISSMEDYKIRRFLEKRLRLAGLTDTIIERSINTVKVIIYVSRPGVVIGRGGANLEILKKELLELLKIDLSDSKGRKVELKVEEVKNADIQANLILSRLQDQLAKRYPHRRAAAQALEKAMASGAKGVKIEFAGRIGGAEIGRHEKYTKGSVPTQTLRADIDYAEAPAFTKSGYVGIKVYVFKGMKATN